VNAVDARIVFISVSLSVQTHIDISHVQIQPQVQPPVQVPLIPAIGCRVFPQSSDCIHLGFFAVQKSLVCISTGSVHLFLSA